MICFIFCSVSATSGYSQTTSSGSGGSTFSQDQDAEKGVSTVESLLSSSGQILFGDEPNSVMVIDYPENIKRVEEYLNMVDVTPQQVHVEARIIEIKLEGESSLGINWTTLANKGLILGGYKVYSTSIAEGITEQIAFKNAYYPPVSGTAAETPFTLTLIGDNINAVMKAIANEYDTNVLSAPSITTVNNKEAEIRMVNVYPWSEATITTTSASGGAPITQITWEVNTSEGGINLKVTPTISEDGKIIMAIQPEVKEKTSDYPVTVTSGSSSVTYTYPIIETRQMMTKVVIGNGETLAIGGLIKNKTIEGESKIPLLGDIPYLGHLFKAKKDVHQKTELLIFVSPTIITPREIAYSAKVEKTIRKDMEGEKSKLNMMPFKEVGKVYEENEKKEKLDALYAKAEALYAEGKLEEAKKVFAEILSLDPTQVEAKKYLETRIPAKVEEIKRQEEAKENQKLLEPYHLAVALVHQKRYEEAYVKFQEFQKIKPGYGKTEYYLEMLPKVIAQEKQAKESIEQKKKKEVKPVPKDQTINKEREVQRLKQEELAKKQRELTEKQKEEAEKIKLENERKIQEAKQKEAELKAKTDDVYQLALALYKEKRYAEAYAKFQEVQTMISGYGRTNYYLNSIPALIEKEKQAEEKRLEKKRKKEIDRMLNNYE
jgi:Flp pilus assembly secretin CpaC